MNIVESIRDKNLFRPYLQGSLPNLDTWANWLTCLKVIYGLPLKESEHELVRKCTGRDPGKLPKDGFRNVLLLCGRRSGKSKIAGLIAGFEALVSKRSLSKGEVPVVAVVCPTRLQTEIVRNYAKAALQSIALGNVIKDDFRDELILKNGITIRTLTGTAAAVRGWTLVNCIVDELAFFVPGTEEVRVKSDAEIVTSVKPSLLQTKGKLIGVSTKFWKKGYCYDTWRKCYGNDNAQVLVWDSPSRLMNPTLAEEDIAAEITGDPVARFEFENEWREDIAEFLSIEVIRSCVVPGRKQLLPRRTILYHAFVDISGGRNDDAALCVAHRDGDTIVIDILERYKAPHSPQDVVSRMVLTLRRYRIQRVTGDTYSAEWVTQAFREHNVQYEKCQKNKSQLYLEILPRLCSPNGIQLVDDETLIRQFAGLQRKQMAGGRQLIDHPSGGHDDLSNAVAGASYLASGAGRRRGGVFLQGTRGYSRDDGLVAAIRSGQARMIKHNVMV